MTLQARTHALLAGGLLAVTACYGPELAAPGAADDGAIVRLDRDTLTVHLTLTALLAATRTDSAGFDQPARIFWSSRKPDVATVNDQGVVRGMRPGSTWIIASDSRHADSAYISVAVTFFSIHAGTNVTCGRGTAGRALCWGANEYGSVGVPTGADTSAPMLVSALGFSEVVTGAGSTCALGNYTLHCWGYNGVGQLGDGTVGNRFEPVRVADTLSITRVLMGAGATTCAYDLVERLLCWGWNAWGQLLTGGLNARKPVVVPAPVPFTTVATGGGHVCALDASGETWCWGRNDRGQLGNGDTSATTRFAIARLSGLPPLVALSSGLEHTCGLSGTGQVWCWGDNRHGQLGTGSSDYTAIPELAAGGLTLDAVTTTWNHTCGLAAGVAWCWGENGAGQLGRGDASGPGQPLPVAGGLRFRTISAGVNHSCGISEDNIAWCWGANATGALGDGTRINRASPVRVRYQP